MTATGATGRAIQPEDLLALATIADARLSPDGRLVAYVVKRAHLDRDEYTSAIHLVSTGADGEPIVERQFTTGSHRDGEPRWSPDGRMLAFVSDRAGKPQIYVIGLAGGEPRQVTHLARGASGPVWSPDGRSLAFLSSEGQGVDDAARERQGGMIRHVTRQRYRFDVAGYSDDRFQHVWVVDVEGGEPRQLTRGDQNDAMPAWSPDGRRIAFVSNRESEADLSFRSQLYVIPADGGAASGDGDGATRVGPGLATAAAPAWSPDGATIACFGHTPETPPGGNNGVYAVPAAGGAPRNLTANFDRSAGSALFSDTWSTMTAPPTLFWAPDGAAAYFTACDHGRVGLYRTTGDGGGALVVGGDRALAFVSPSAAGDRFAYAAGDFTTPCDLYTCGADGADERRLTRLNAGLLGELPLQQPKHIPFTSFDGRFEVDAWLIRPAGYDPARRYPLVQIIHGGPHSIFGHVFFFDMQLWASCGWNVLFVNPRASQGYGEEFATANLADWGGADWREQEQALDLAIERGGVDPTRLAVTGLSYGGFMTDWIIGHTDRYRAAVSENGICNLVSFFTTSDIGWFWLEGEMGGRAVWDNLDWYMAHSPINYVTRITTPTLFLQAETDYRCPIEQGEQFYTALRARGVPTEMVRFPGESHAFLSGGKPQSRLERRRHTLRWFERYL
ncbi:MAG TPA: S9 family peptidase [Thermomicrobiales bacterium]|nr:S9 family peptidase [Thermomicrobiales bacterium]